MPLLQKHIQLFHAITRDTSLCYIMTLNTALPRKRDSFWVKKIGCTSGSFQNILHKRRNYFYGICRTQDATRCQQQITYSWNAVRSSFSVLNFGSCPIQHVTCLQLRRKQMSLQAEQMHKMTSILLKIIKVVILKLKLLSFCQLLSL